MELDQKYGHREIPNVWPSEAQIPGVWPGFREVGPRPRRECKNRRSSRATTRRNGAKRSGAEFRRVVGRLDRRFLQSRSSGTTSQNPGQTPGIWAERSAKRSEFRVTVFLAQWNPVWPTPFRIFLNKTFRNHNNWNDPRCSKSSKILEISA